LCLIAFFDILLPMNRGFWDNLELPIIGLAPMDGVTDAAFRYMVCKYGKPSLVMTEFTNVEGLARGATKMLRAFEYHDMERPVVAQIYGVEVDSFYKCSVMLCEMGFDGIDINMGCPANAVARHGSGAGLIRTPELAREIIKACKKGVQDWSEGITMEEAGVHKNIILEARKMTEGRNVERKMIPVSVKTRIGYDKIVTEEWIQNLLEENPANITLHGRTLKQMYMGQSNWDEIAKAAAICKGTGVSLIGNGDVSSMEDAKNKCEQYGVDGVLVGRATFGTPWFFSDKEPDLKERLEIMIEHAKYFESLGDLYFPHIRKHLGWYCKGFDGAKELRKQLVIANDSSEVCSAVQDFQNSHPF